MIDPSNEEEAKMKKSMYVSYGHDYAGRVKSRNKIAYMMRDEDAAPTRVRIKDFSIERYNRGHGLPNYRMITRIIESNIGKNANTVFSDLIQQFNLRKPSNWRFREELRELIFNYLVDEDEDCYYMRGEGGPQHRVRKTYPNHCGSSRWIYIDEQQRIQCAKHYQW